MITLAQVLAGLVVVGLVGSALEKAGQSLNLPRLESVGKIMEGIASDAPKIITNIFSAVKGKQ